MRLPNSEVHYEDALVLHKIKLSSASRTKSAHKMKILPIFYTLLSSAYAIVPEAQIHQIPLEKNQPARLPNLVKLNSIFDLSPKWNVKGAMFLEEGRLVVKEQSGAIWSKEPLVDSKKDWTVEVVFRNSERVDVDDHLYFDSNGFSFWLLDSEAPQDSANYGGPQVYDGLHFLINNKEGRGLKIFANDRTKKLANSKALSLGECDLNYLDSMVPFTLRISYSSKNSIFKVQVDNNLCFRTNKLTFDKLKNDFSFGVSASTDPQSQEYWELLRLDTHNELTEDAIDDHDLIQEGLVKMVTVTQVDDSKATESPVINRKSLMENVHESKSHNGLANFDTHIDDINKKLESLEMALSNIDNSQVLELSVALQEVKDVQTKQLAVLEDMKKTNEELRKLLSSQFKEMVSSVGILHQKVIDEIKHHQLETHNIEDKVDLLMVNHKEILKQYMNYAGELDRKSDSSEFFNVVVKWVLVPFFVLMAGLSLLVYRLRKDIKHSKII